MTSSTSLLCPSAPSSPRDGHETNIKPAASLVVTSPSTSWSILCYYVNVDGAESGCGSCHFKGPCRDTLRRLITLSNATTSADVSALRLSYWTPAADQAEGSEAAWLHPHTHTTATMLFSFSFLYGCDRLIFPLDPFFLQSSLKGFHYFF